MSRVWLTEMETSEWRTKLVIPFEKSIDLLGSNGRLDGSERSFEVAKWDGTDVALWDCEDRLPVETESADRAEICLGAQLPNVRTRVALRTVRQRVQLWHAQLTVHTRYVRDRPGGGGGCQCESRGRWRHWRSSYSCYWWSQLGCRCSCWRLSNRRIAAVGAK